MWKAVIIDDDRQVLRVMKKVIPWEELGIVCVGEGTDGEQGLQLIMETKPDIVLTDIYMPIMNGMEMLQNSRENGFNGKVIILSGYSDFEYARTALRLNVHDYLSKPVSIETIESVLTGVISKLEEEKDIRNDQEDLTQKLEYYQSLYSNTWIKSIMMGIEDLAALQLKKESLNLVDRKHMVIAVQINQNEEQDDALKPDWASLRNIFRKMHIQSGYSALYNVEWVELSYYYSAILLSFDRNVDESSCMNFTKSIIGDFVNKLSYVTPESISVGIGTLKDNWSEISNSTEEAIRAAYFSSNEKIVSCYEEVVRNESKIPQLKLELQRPVQFYRELSEAIKHNQRESALKIVDDFVNGCIEKKTYLPYQWKMLCKELWIVLTYSLYDNGLNLEEIFSVKEITHQIDDINHIVQFERWMCEKISLISHYQQMNDKENIRHKQAVDYMIQYINEHYSENITLNELSEQVYISRNYLSQIFKKTTGLSFNHYVNKVRMEKAKFLILEGRFLIYEIAEKVGFKNTPYFSSLFKKYTGVNPTDLLKQ
jgi:two-component system, response regulator YesN